MTESGSKTAKSASAPDLMRPFWRICGDIASRRCAGISEDFDGVHQSKGFLLADVFSEHAGIGAGGTRMLENSVAGNHHNRIGDGQPHHILGVGKLGDEAALPAVTFKRFACKPLACWRPPREWRNTPGGWLSQSLYAADSIVASCGGRVRIGLRCHI